jgi:DNA-binding response OmpR family regulator
MTGLGPARGRALVVDDDEAYRASIAACVRLTGCGVQQALDLGRALTLLDRQKFDLVVWGVPAAAGLSPNGADTAELRLRTEGGLVVIADDFSTAQVYLDGGADQWLPKPFVPGALLAAVRVALRKLAVPLLPASARLEVRGLVMDGSHRTLACAGRVTTLTGQEWDLMMILLAHPNRYLSAHDILRLGWRSGDYGPESVRIYVHRLRKKFEPMKLPCELLSQHGQGYCLQFA